MNYEDNLSQQFNANESQYNCYFEDANPFEVYVKPGSVGGDGTPANPFGTIQEAVATVESGGTVIMMEGSYALTEPVHFLTPNITLKGNPSALIVVTAPITAFKVSSFGNTFDGIRITGNNPYPFPFFEITKENNKFINNIISGPLQTGNPSDWIMNQGLSAFNITANLFIQQNIFFSLYQAVYIDSALIAFLTNNVVYNSGGIFVDNTNAIFSGNSWGTPENTFDITILPNNLSGPPYDPIHILRTNNSCAKVDDRRLNN